jgi:hypothetical protein
MQSINFNPFKKLPLLEHYMHEWIIIFIKCIIYIQQIIYSLDNRLYFIKYFYLIFDPFIVFWQRKFLKHARMAYPLPSSCFFIIKIPLFTLVTVGINYGQIWVEYIWFLQIPAKQMFHYFFEANFDFDFLGATVTENLIFCVRNIY